MQTLHFLRVFIYSDNSAVYVYLCIEIYFKIYVFVYRHRYPHLLLTVVVQATCLHSALLCLGRTLLQMNKEDVLMGRKED